MEVDVHVLPPFANREQRRGITRYLRSQSSKSVKPTEDKVKSGKKGPGGKHIWRTYKERLVLKENVRRFKQLHGLSDYDFQSYGGEMISKSTLELFINKPEHFDAPTTATQEWKLSRKLGVPNREDIYQPIDFENLPAQLEVEAESNNKEVGNKIGRSTMKLTSEQREALLDRVTEFMAQRNLTQQEFMTFAPGVAVLETELDNILFGNEEVSETLMRNIANRMGLSIKEALEPMTTLAEAKVFEPLQGEQAGQARSEAQLEERQIDKARKIRNIELSKTQRNAIKANVSAYMQINGLRTITAVGKALHVSHIIYTSIFDTAKPWAPTRGTIKKIAEGLGLNQDQLLKPNVPVIAKLAKKAAKTQAEPVLEQPKVEAEVTEAVQPRMDVGAAKHQRRAKASTVTSHQPVHPAIKADYEQGKEIASSIEKENLPATQEPSQELVPADRRRLNLKVGRVRISAPVDMLKAFNVDDDGNINLEL